MLTLWRNKLRASDDPDRFFNAVRAVIAETGVIAGKQYTSTASTRINRICGSDRWRAAGCPRGRSCVAVMLVLDSDRNWWNHSAGIRDAARREGMIERPATRRYEPLAKEDLSQRAARELRGAILGGAYAPGDRLPSERELAEQFGVDRHTLRSAVHELELLGLITRRQGAGAHVLPYRETATLDLVPYLVTKPGTEEPDPEVIGSIIDVERIMFAGMVSLLVERATDDDFAVMHAALADLGSATRTGTMQDVAATKLVLIRSMFRATHSIVCELFVNTYQRMIRGAIDPAGHLQDLWVQRVASGTHELFGALIAAAEQGDEATAQQLLQAILDEMLAIGMGPGARVGGVTEKEVG